MSQPILIVLIVISGVASMFYYLRSWPKAIKKERERLSDAATTESCGTFLGDSFQAVFGAISSAVINKGFSIRKAQHKKISYNIAENVISKGAHTEHRYIIFVDGFQNDMDFITTAVDEALSGKPREKNPRLYLEVVICFLLEKAPKEVEDMPKKDFIVVNNRFVIMPVIYNYKKGELFYFNTKITGMLTKPYLVVSLAQKLVSEIFLPKENNA